MPDGSFWDWWRNLGLPVWRRPRLGLALGGGGARGYAHIGVLHVLEREGIPVHFLAGASMGGLVAAASATRINADALEAKAHTLSAMDLLDPVLFQPGLIGGNKILEQLRSIFGDATVQGTAIPLRLVAVDVDTGEELQICEGPLAEAVRATTSFPGVICPARWQGRLLVDGGVRNNVPADVIRDMGAEVVIAVSVGWTAFQPLTGVPVGQPLSPTGLLRRSPMVNAIERCMNIMQAEMVERRLERAHPDLVISPQLGQVQIEDFARVDEVIAYGQQAAEAALPVIRTLMAPRLLISRPHS